MAKGWPTISAGVFYPGYKKGAAEGRSPGTRDNNKIGTPPAHRKMTVRGRILYPAGDKLTAVKMRKPL